MIECKITSLQTLADDLRDIQKENYFVGIVDMNGASAILYRPHEKSWGEMADIINDMKSKCVADGSRMSQEAKTAMYQAAASLMAAAKEIEKAINVKKAMELMDE